MKTGRYNVGVGLLVMGSFTLYGFLLIYYLRDFAPGKQPWGASYSVARHFELRMLQQVRRGESARRRVPFAERCDG